jgi:heme A synthase
LSGLALGSAAAAYALVIFGSHVRVSDSGMGCPDWPLCSGQVGPIYEFHALMEQTHRYLAAVVTILAFLTALVALRSGGHQRSVRRSPAVRPAVFTAAVIVVQIALGALTVFAGNAAPTVAAHLIAGVAMLCGATVTSVCALVPARTAQLPAPAGGHQPPRPGLGRVAWLAVSSAGVLFISGSLVVNAEAEQACASFPLCPSGQPSEVIWPHLLHRGIAVLAGAALLTFSMHAWRQWSAVRGARRLAATLAVLVVATATIGVFSALLKAPADVQDLHLAGAAGVLAISVALAAVGWLAGADADGQGAGAEPDLARQTQHLVS